VTGDWRSVTGEKAELRKAESLQPAVHSSETEKITQRR